MDAKCTHYLRVAQHVCHLSYYNLSNIYIDFEKAYLFDCLSLFVLRWTCSLVGAFQPPAAAHEHGQSSAYIYTNSQA